MTKRVKLKLSARLLKKKSRKKSFSLVKHCRFCSSPEHAQQLDYKNANMLKGFLTERGKILPLRISGNCSFHQRALAHAIKKARTMALVPYLMTTA